ncbi:hypothetical protein HPB47_008349 [Ixodes persulcatus]|uniref:Uncharacterized protein n=1 Tax=Ixodes persulcatus TaxID=34615 RepID=A0AC60P4Z8_IXOPE|nr:hypothetical protein HPB47_008349 [Ixodes persulcatus]
MRMQEAMRLQNLKLVALEDPVIRSAVTRATNELQALLDFSDATAGELTESLNILELKGAALKAVNSEIEDGVDIDHLEEEMESVEAYQVSICRLRTRATLKLDALHTPNNASNALELLQDRDQGHLRFGQTQAIIDDHTTRLLNIKNITMSSDVTALRRLYDDITINVHRLEALGVKAEEYSVLLHAAVKKRLPDDLVLRYCQQRATDIADSTGSLQTFLNFLKSEVESRERVMEIKPNQANLPKAQKEDSSNQLREKNTLPVPEEDVPEPKQSSIKSELVHEEAVRKDSDLESDETEALKWAPYTVLTHCNSPSNSRKYGLKDDREAAGGQLLSEPVGCQHELSASDSKEDSGIPDGNVMSNDGEGDEETPIGAVETRGNILKPANLISVFTETQEGKVVSVDCKKFRKRDRPGGTMSSPS